jgi:thioredoxin 1
MSKVTQINSNEFEELVLKSDKPVLVDFFADWCGPCKMLLPTLDKLAETQEDVFIVKINVDDNVDLAKQYNVRGIPTMLLIKDGGVVDRVSGNKTLDDLKKFLN